MAEETGISWCDATFNPWIGCAKVSPGCALVGFVRAVVWAFRRPA